ncbi:hypothetical protein [cf. Phormidesmis sp. LEGE 11477]|uniref:hypothetical protein n=1 Tax=cf. Phormidesmis sp. LEGE 11477 TaxID=1828680 RepID=UPI0018818B6C|nr:hypothetical protein [cf. Phormidesmis sp. LEGE 11477]MBE9061574.1 hypothetical protein [cf. Phormidesmis sp. LEGE 11477]
MTENRLGHQLLTPNPDKLCLSNTVLKGSVALTLGATVGTVAACWGLLASSSLGQPTSPVAPLIVEGASIEGNLSDVDTRLDDGSFYDRYDFMGRSGEYATIYLESEDFDPYLILLDPTGERISENDDISRTNDDSRLVVRLPITGRYTVLANSYESGREGSYRIRIDVEESREGLARTLAAAAVPGSSLICTNTILSATEEIETNRETSVLVSSLQLSRLYESIPESRPYGMYLSLSGAAATSILQSPQFLERLSSELIESCSSVGAIFFGANSLEEERIFGLLERRSVRGRQSLRVSLFDCLNRSQGANARLQWGKQVCAL